MVYQTRSDFSVHPPIKMKNNNLEASAFSIVIVSQDNSITRNIAAAIQSNQLLKSRSHVLTVSQVRAIKSAEVDEICVVLVVVSDLVQKIDSLEQLYADIEAVRANNSASTFVFVGLLEAEAVIDRQDLIVNSGLDLTADIGDAAKTLPNVFGLLRFSQSIVHGRRARLEREDSTRPKVGDWTLLVWSSSVKLPDGKVRALTKAEWDYLNYLVERDVLKTNVTNDVERKIGQQPRQNALVHKLKAKLGASFPIVPSGAGRYRIHIGPNTN